MPKPIMSTSIVPMSTSTDARSISRPPFTTWDGSLTPSLFLSFTIRRRRPRITAP